MSELTQRHDTRRHWKYYVFDLNDARIAAFDSADAADEMTVAFGADKEVAPWPITFFD